MSERSYKKRKEIEMKWCIRVYSEEFARYMYLTMLWISHGSVNFTTETMCDFIKYDTKEQAQRVIDNHSKTENDQKFWAKAEPFEYTPTKWSVPEWKYKSRVVKHSAERK